MTEKGIFTQIEENIETISEENIDQYLPDLVKFYQPQFGFFARKSVANTSVVSNEIFLAAFSCRAKEKIKESFLTYLKKDRADQRNLKGYIGQSLQNLSLSVFWENADIKKKVLASCPYCKFKNKAKEILTEENGSLRCTWCSKLAQAIEDNIKNGISSCSENLKLELAARKVFALHSRSGYKCSDCCRFIPNSATQSNFFVCPYDDCGEFGPVSNLNSMLHPLAVGINPLSSNKTVELPDYLSIKNISAPAFLEIKEDFEAKFDLIKLVVSEQVDKLKRINSATTVTQMSLMYEAFYELLNKQPEDMVQYLYHQKIVAEPLQAKIFQEYVRLVEDSLPFEIVKKGKEKTIVSLTDPDLSLFMGLSTFQGEVDNEQIITNNTTERYIGGRNYKDYGPCFIGKLVDVKVNGSSVLNLVKEYSFSKIWMKDLKPGTKVEVTHFRIPSHYEMHSMVYLQKVRKNLVDSIYFRVHGKKRGTRV